ncbi:hypothetical protein [Nonomuraea sp. NPDC049758]|uniref:hypothetical protein n=1 Tax=Nonomuraea sp. NPDC049758 TaxID=3154360 RepID=UPI0034133831
MTTMWHVDAYWRAVDHLLSGRSACWTIRCPFVLIEHLDERTCTGRPDGLPEWEASPP